MVWARQVWKEAVMICLEDLSWRSPEENVEV